MPGGRMCLISSNRHFERCEEDTGDEIADGYKYFQTLTTFLSAALFFSLQITYQNPKFLIISFTACLTSLIFQQ